MTKNCIGLMGWIFGHTFEKFIEAIKDRRNMKKLIIVTILLCLDGCATHNTDYIPVAAQCPAPKIEPKPDYPKLSPNATAPEFAKWCIVRNTMCSDALERCRIQLQGYEYD